MSGFISSSYSFSVFVTDKNGIVNMNSWAVEARFYNSGDKEPAIIKEATISNDGYITVSLSSSDTTNYLKPGSIRIELWRIDQDQTILAYGNEEFREIGNDSVNYK